MIDIIELPKVPLSNYIDLKNFIATEQYRNKKGIYFLFDSNKRLMYIGKASNIGNRVIQHRENYHVGVHYHYFQYTEIECPADRDIYETYYINKLEPPLNREKTFLYESSYEDMKYVSEKERQKEKQLEVDLECAMKNFRKRKSK